MSGHTLDFAPSPKTCLHYQVPEMEQVLCGSAGCGVLEYQTRLEDIAGWCQYDRKSYAEMIAVHCRPSWCSLLAAPHTRRPELLQT